MNTKKIEVFLGFLETINAHMPISSCELSLHEATGGSGSFYINGKPRMYGSTLLFHVESGTDGKWKINFRDLVQVTKSGTSLQTISDVISFLAYRKSQLTSCGGSCKAQFKYTFTYAELEQIKTRCHKFNFEYSK